MERMVWWKHRRRCAVSRSQPSGQDMPYDGSCEWKGGAWIAIGVKPGLRKRAQLPSCVRPIHCCLCGSTAPGAPNREFLTFPGLSWKLQVSKTTTNMRFQNTRLSQNVVPMGTGEMEDLVELKTNTTL